MTVEEPPGGGHRGGAAARRPRCPDPRRILLHGRQLEVGCSRRSCPSCGLLWLQDTHIRAIAASQALGAPVALASITAPGQDVLPWDETGRRVCEAEAREWNETAPARWSALYDAARRRARAAVPVAPGEWALWFKAWEYQKRGVLHLHLVVPMGTPRQAAHSTALVAALAALAPAYGFGYVDRGKLPDSGRRQSARRLVPVEPGRAAAYVAGYLSGVGIGKGGIYEVAQAQGVPGALLYVSRKLTSASGVTMRSLKARRRVVCRYPDALKSAEHWAAACVVDGIDRSRPPLPADLRAALLQRALAEGWTSVVDIETGEQRAATAAPCPPGLLGGNAVIPRRSRRGLLRLDSVLHRADDSPSGWCFVTVVRDDHGGMWGTPSYDPTQPRTEESPRRPRGKRRYGCRRVYRP